MSLAKIDPKVFLDAEVEKALREFAPKMRPWSLDGRYWLLRSAEWDEIIKSIGPEHNKYIADRFDCDAFSRVWYGRVAETYEINGMMIVVDFDSEHSYNLLLQHDGSNNISCRLFEPQTLSHPTPGPKPYSMGRGFML